MPRTLKEGDSPLAVRNLTRKTTIEAVQSLSERQKEIEMTQVLWEMVKEKLIAPHADVKLESYDLGLRTGTAPKTR